MPETRLPRHGSRQRLRWRSIAVAAMVVSTSSAWFGCNQLFSIEGGNLIEAPAESGAADGTVDTGATDTSTASDGRVGADGPVPDSGSDVTDAGAEPSCVNGSCPVDTQCCYDLGLNQYCRKDAEPACPSTCRSNADCVGNASGQTCCVNYVTQFTLGLFCHSAGDCIPFCQSPKDCTNGLPCTPWTCEGGIPFGVCGDAAPICHDGR